MSSGTKRSRGTSAIAASTRSSSMPRRRSCRSTMRARLRAKGSSVDVVAEPFRLMDRDLPPPQRHHARALECGEEAAGALPGGAGRGAVFGLGGLVRTVLLRAPPPRAAVGRPESRAPHPPAHGWEGL